LLWLFGDGVSPTICPGWPQTVILPISVSQIARITGVSHCTQHVCTLLPPSSASSVVQPESSFSNISLKTLQCLPIALYNLSQPFNILCELAFAEVLNACLTPLADPG
jgi:hypothetical protein